MDKAILDLAPYALRASLADELALHLATSFATSDVNSQRIAPNAIKEAFAAAARRLGIDPWLTADLQVGRLYRQAIQVDMLKSFWLYS